ncbi:hypothetical protein IFM89_032814 [Coptis chinensis]|uniref:PAZ domain-containing protein n=1 Tax=Coptis chinensis TaxID=261450 RepID=A0A835LS74_9MAGN|nr:hypothetical protein IFM89_032814 [Coptis chinensis]
MPLLLFSSQILDIVLRELSTKRFCAVGRSFFSLDIRTPQRLGEGLESWCGFYQSIRPTQMGLSLNIGLFPIDDHSNMKSVVEYFQEMYGFIIQHTHLPCLQVGNQKKANYLPMEAGFSP